MIITSKSYEDTKKIGYELARKLDTGSHASRFIALRGEMGVGKTAFTSGFASYFGISGVKSPTYTVVNEYVGDKRIFHFDMYRIADGDDLYSIGYDEYIESDGYSVCEWSENIEDFIPEDAVFVTIERVPEDTSARKITIDIADGDI